MPPFILTGGPSPAVGAPQLRAFDDIDTLRSNIYDGVMKGLQSRFPIENDRYRLELLDTQLMPKDYSLAEQKKAILRGRSLGVPVVGTWRLLDKSTNQEVDRVRRNILNVPYITPQGVYVYRGNQYTVSNQARLRPGVYARRRESGELETHFNVRPRTGRSFRVVLEPETGIFKLTVGQANLKLLPILKRMGLNDEQIRRAWGNDLTAANQSKDDPTAYPKALARLGDRRSKTAVGEPVEQKLLDVLAKAELDPGVTSKTLGAPYGNVTPEVLLRATQKMINISRKEEDTDDRDSMEFQSIHDAADLFRERIERDAGMSARKLLWRATYRGDLKSARTGQLTDQLESALYGSGLGMPLEEINPTEILDKNLRLIRLGEGGISCFSEDTEVMTRTGWKPWPSVTKDDELACRADGRLSYERPLAVHAGWYEGAMLRGVTDRIDYLVTPDHRLYVSGATTGSGHRHAYGEWAFRTAGAVHGKKMRHLTAVGPIKDRAHPDTFIIYPAPIEDANRGSARKGPLSINFMDWVKLVGVYLADGSFTYKPERKEYRTEIGKIRSKNPNEYEYIRTLLDCMPINYRYEQGRRFVLTGNHLAHYFSVFGKSRDKFVPAYIMTGGQTVKRAFFEAITTMDHAGNLRGPSFVYSSASRRLLEQVAHIAIELGFSVTYNDRSKPNNPRYTARIRKASYTAVTLQKKKDQYQTVPYRGHVYCASVPGELLLVRRNGKVSWSGNSIDSVPDDSRDVQPSQFSVVDSIISPESEKIGIDLRTAINSFKGSDGQIYSSMINVRSNQEEKVSARDLANSVIAFPGEMKKPGRFVRAMERGRLAYTRKKDVDYELPHASEMFTAGSNLVPMISAIKGQRLMMGARMSNQALPVSEPEAPFVQSADRDGNSFERRYGEAAGAVRARAPGRVAAVSRSGIAVKQADGTTRTYELYDNFPYNRKTYSHNTPAVSVGDPVDEGTLLASSNYTDREGTLALGKNLRVGYLPWRGNFEDAIVISESAAKKLSSEHMYGSNLDIDDQTRTGRSQYLSFYPSKYIREQTDKLDSDGVVREGQKVSKGDPLALAFRFRKPRPGEKLFRQKTQDASLEWDHEHDGVVTDVIKSKGGTRVFVKALSPMEVGDKMAGRYGDKGIVREIVPDNEMPKDAQGRPLEVSLNPLGVITRVNPAQVFEAALGKIAEKRGAPYKMPAFTDDTLVDFVEKELKAHGVSDTEDIVDPDTGKKIPNVLVGNRFFMKLHHTAESKESGRDIGAYTLDMSPAKGGPTGCFPARQKLLTMHGERGIGRIVEKRQSPLVWAFNECSGAWGFYPVTDWFTYYADVDQLLAVHVRGAVASTPNRKVKWDSCLYPTRNHKVYTYDGRTVLAGELTTEDKLVGWGPQLTDVHRNIILGGMLGDASAAGGMIQFEHSKKQDNYLAWKLELLSGLLPESCDRTGVHSPSSLVKGKRNSRHGYVNYPHVVDWAEEVCLCNGKKKVTDRWLSLGELGIAVWLLDDGSITNCAKKKGRINYSGDVATCGFCEGDVERLAGWLTIKLGASCVKRKTGPYWRIGLSADACRNAIGLIARWVPYTAIPKAKKFLANQVKKLQKTVKPAALSGAAPLDRIPLSIKRIEPYVHDRPSIKRIPVYDVSVGEAHNYTVGGALVSNSKRVGGMELTALVSHGGSEIIRDIKNVRGQRNDDFWKAFRMGYSPPTPRVPFAYQKFMAYLQGAGVNVHKQGESTNIMALTDNDVGLLSGGEVSSRETVRSGDLRPIPNGLFDPKIFGGHGGRRWGHITLAEPMPNPVMEDVVRRLLDVTKNELRDIVAGRKALYGVPGGKGIQDALSRIDVDREMEVQRQVIDSGSRSKRDAAVKKLGYLKMFKKTGLKPADLVMTKVPVLPTMFRPISKYMTSGGREEVLVTDPNQLYAALLEANDSYKDVKSELGRRHAADEALALYDSFKAVTGLGDPVKPQLVQRRVRGLLSHIFGGSPKAGDYQRRVLGSAVDVVGRAVVAPNPSMDMDHVGMPEEQAWRLYRPFVMRRLVRGGVPPTMAARMIAGQDPRAKRSLLEEMSSRPVLVNRNPTLHKYGIMAAYPVLVKGKTLQVSPITTGGFGMDFNGDSCVSDFVPIRVNEKLHVGTFEEFIRTYIYPEYREDTAVSVLGAGTWVMPISPYHSVEVPGLGADGKPAWLPVNHISIHTSHGPKCFNVKTRAGLDAVFTAHHNMWSLDDQCRLIPVKTEKMGRLVPKLTGLPFPSVLPTGAPREIESGFGPGFWFGYWLADGSLTGRSDTVSQASTDAELLRYLTDVGDAVTGVRHWVEKNGNSARWTSKPWFAWFSREFGTNCSTKRIAGWMLAMPEPFRKGVLAGFIAGEAEITPRSIQVEVVNRKLLLGMQAIAATLNVRTSITRGRPASNNRKATWILRVNNLTLEAAGIAWPAVGKVRRFDRAAGKSRNQVDYVPLPGWLKPVLTAQGKKAQRKARPRAAAKVDSKALAKAFKCGFCTRRLALRLISLYGLDELSAARVKRWTELVNDTSIEWDVVKCVKPCARPDVTYDFSVRGKEAFCVDGFFLTHNTAQFHVPVSEEARREAIERLLPSKNLLSQADFDVHYVPKNEYALGLYQASSMKSDKPERVFRSKEDAIAAFMRGELPLDAQVRIP